MSAYSELLGFYPLGSSIPLSQPEITQSLPPFEVTNKDETLALLADNPTLDGFQPVPIHMGSEVDKILRGQDLDVCPKFAQLKAEAMADPIFQQRTEAYKKSVIKKLHEQWGLDENFDIQTVDPYTDSYYSAMFDQRLKEVNSQS